MVILQMSPICFEKLHKSETTRIGLSIGKALFFVTVHGVLAVICE